MGKTQRWMTAVIVLAVFTAIPAWAQRDPTLKNERLWYFFNDAFQGEVALKGNAKFVQDKNDPRGLEWRLRLTSDYGQASTAFMKQSYPLSDYEATFTFEVRRVSPGEAPADGFMFVASSDFFPIGAPGAGIGYAPVFPIVPPSGQLRGGAGSYSYGVEFNSAVGQGLPGSPETAAIDILGLRTRFSQTPFSFVDRGPVTVAIRVTPFWMRAWVETATGPRTILQSPLWMNGFFQPPDRLWFGFTAGTGGARQIVDIYQLVLRSNEPLSSP
jgi:hypothetical protein